MLLGTIQPHMPELMRIEMLPAWSQGVGSRELDFWKLTLGNGIRLGGPHLLSGWGVKGEASDILTGAL